MATPSTNRLVIGGPYNGDKIHWRGDLVEYPDCTYRLKKIKLNDSVLEVYIDSSLTDAQALTYIKENYLGV